MAKTTATKQEKIISALGLWKEYDLTRALDELVLREEVDAETGFSYTVLQYNGRDSEDGGVRVFAYFARPAGEKRCPAILLLKEADKPMDVALMQYFVQKGYAVLMPVYSGNMEPIP
jgi:dipeptidyl aminopeptidase/acylaminoacyl peptidase